MEAFKTRLMQEYVELNERTEKLEEFILKNPKFESLETEIRTSMLAQKEAMKEYRHRLWLQITFRTGMICSQKIG